MLNFRTNPLLDSSLKDQCVCAHMRMHTSNYEYDLTDGASQFLFCIGSQETPRFVIL